MQYMMRNFGFVVLTGLAAMTAAVGLAQSGTTRSTARYLDSSDGRDWPGYGRTLT